MTASPELQSLHRAVDDLHRCVASLRSAYGDVGPVRRVVNDAERLTIDVHDVDGLPPPRPHHAVEIRSVADEPYDPAAWADSDDEGVGGYHGPTR